MESTLNALLKLRDKVFERGGGRGFWFVARPAICWAEPGSICNHSALSFQLAKLTQWGVGVSCGCGYGHGYGFVFAHECVRALRETTSARFCSKR